MTGTLVLVEGPAKPAKLPPPFPGEPEARRFALRPACTFALRSARPFFLARAPTLGHCALR